MTDNPVYFDKILKLQNIFNDMINYLFFNYVGIKKYQNKYMWLKLSFIYKVIWYFEILQENFPDVYVIIISLELYEDINSI